MKDLESGRVYSCHQVPERPVEFGLRLLAEADEVIGHNILTYDLPTIRRLYPSFNTNVKVTDTLVLSRLIFTDLENDDFRSRDSGNANLPSTLIGKHSLEAWGYRLGILKGLFAKSTDWKNWSPEMQKYCEQDVEVTHALLKLIEREKPSEESVKLEHEFRWVIHLQEKFGFRFDKEAAGRLHATLVQRKETLKRELEAVFPPRIEAMKTPAYWLDAFGTKYATKGEGLKAKAPNLVKGPLRKKEYPFNPGSRQQVGDRLIAMGWKPEVFTDGGQPKIDDDTLNALPYPQAKPIAEYFTIEKRIGQLADGENAWLKLERNGRIHGSVITNGAVTGRCTHFNPNVAQVPKVGSPYGAECRALFTADPGFVMIGADAAGLELRGLSHYMARYDGGAYGKIVCEGDPHAANRDAAGFSPDKAGREKAKTFIYAYCYGAGDVKLGSIAGVTPEEMASYKSDKKEWDRVVRYQKRRKQPADDQTIAYHFKGQQLRAQFLQKTPAMAQLISDIRATVQARGYLIGLDGRKLHIRSQHSALNTLIQSAGAILVKKATTILYDRLTKLGLQFGQQWSMLAHVHDEFQIQVRPDLAEQVKQVAIEAFREAGEYFRFRVPIKGEAKIGSNWKETH